ncbi:sulfite exporter TauE/SafE family protein [Candidatus Woesearchaeota archaeon]|nr:sulfite exporter TauE/SafE family protein [Candidatus Woesearchaeota archaeon]
MKKVSIDIEGMHCRSCEVLLEQNFKKIKGVKEARVDHSRGKAVLTCEGDITIEKLKDAVQNTNYTIKLEPEENIGESKITIKKEHLETGAIFLLVVAAYIILKQVNIIPSNIGIGENVSYGLAFILGIIASLSTCLAVTGGLLLGISTKYSEQHPALTKYQKFKPHIVFNISRIIAYGIFGGIIGLIGSTMALSPIINGVLIIIVSVVMMLLGLQLLNIFPGLQKYNIRMPKYIAHKIHENQEQGKTGPVILGALTFFLPCGFTQALQIYVLSTGSAILGAGIMTSFALGTAPALITLGVVSSYTSGKWKNYFVKTAGSIVLIFGIISITGGLTLIGIDWNNPSSKDTQNAIAPGIEVQTIEMNVVGLDYSPSKFIIQKGVPVEWKVDGTKAQGCAQILTVPKLGITKRLTKDVNVIKFTPENTGTIHFTCGMGMAGPGTFEVIA